MIAVLCDPDNVAVRSAVVVFMKMWAASGQGLLESAVGLAPSPWVCGYLDHSSLLLPRHLAVLRGGDQAAAWPWGPRAPSSRSGRAAWRTPQPLVSLLVLLL